ncbi:MAG: RteC domain-containing protein [Pseudobacter sp.]|uniref:RteC domain-containing protein n=1 Tax=Pseudobacter sp. TaxID=2045420 RepID=UPI003F7D3145
MKRGVAQDIVAFYSSSISAIEKQETIREAAGESLQKRAEKMIDFLKDILVDLRRFMAQYDFLSQREEVQFFKAHNPVLLHYLIYYAKVYTLELRTSIMKDEERRKMLKKERKVLQSWTHKNDGFFRYVKSGATDLDDKYFLKTSADMTLITDPGQWLLTETFLTVPSYLVAEHLANEKYDAYLQAELKFSRHDHVAANGNGKGSIVWTAPKIAAAEIIYEFYFSGFINQGTAQLREIAEAFETIFHIDLGNLYRHAMDLKIKKDRHQYTRKMMEASDRGFDAMNEGSVA